MKSEHIMNFLKDGSFSMPYYLIQFRKELSVSDMDLIVLAYLENLGDHFLFNPEEIQSRLNMTQMEIMMSISNLTDKHLITVESIKNEKGVMEEYISLEDFYRKVTSLLVEHWKKEEEKGEEIQAGNVYEAIEKEFGRPLSPMEYEIIKAWLDSGTDEDMIMEALKEPTYNGVANLRYIDKIIYDWSKKGYKSVEEVRRHNARWKEEKSKQQEQKEVEKPKEIFDFDWFDDDDSE